MKERWAQCWCPELRCLRLRSFRRARCLPTDIHPRQQEPWKRAIGSQTSEGGNEWRELSLGNQESIDHAGRTTP